MPNVVGKVKMAASSKTKGRVAAQSPKHGEKLRQHGKVDLIVSKG